MAWGIRSDPVPWANFTPDFLRFVVVVSIFDAEPVGAGGGGAGVGIFGGGGMSGALMHI